MYNLLQNFKSKVSFKGQLLTFFIIAVGIIATTTSIITAWQTSTLIRESTITTGLQLTNNFAEKSLIALLTDSSDNSQEAINSTLGFASVSGVAIFKTNSELLVASSKNEGNQFYKPFGDALLSLNVDSLQLHNETNDAWLFSSPVIFINEQDDFETVDPTDEETVVETVGYVLVEYDKAELHQIIKTILINNLLIGFLVALLLTLLMNWGINRLIKPLMNLSKTMKIATDSPHYPKASVRGATEIRLMASAYNQMMSSIESKNKQLKKHRDTLESEVLMRTEALKVARDTALTANRHKSEFLANISHELRTPLQAIIGYTDLVKEDLELECMDTQVEDLNKSIRSAHSLLALINNILDIAKIEAGRMDLYLKPVDMKKLIEETFETILPMAVANGNNIVIKQDNLMTTLTLDRQKLMQIFLNLLSNACKFTKNGEITFTINNDLHFLYFAVSDTGVGIPKDQLNAIFEQFTQVDASQTRKFEGTGLGMAITQNFCQLMSGEIEVNSVVGVGSRFSVKLPLNR